MANPNPEPHPENLQSWGKGQSGNAEGYSRSRRLSDALIRYIEEKGLEPALIQTWLAMSLGQKEALQGRNPDYRWFAMLLERFDGKVPDKVIREDDVPTARRISVPPRKRKRSRPDGPGGHEADGGDRGGDAPA